MEQLGINSGFVQLLLNQAGLTLPLVADDLPHRDTLPSIAFSLTEIGILSAGGAVVPNKSCSDAGNNLDLSKKIRSRGSLVAGTECERLEPNQNSDEK